MEDLDDIVQIDANYTGVPAGIFKPGEYVLVKREMTAGDDAWIQNHAVTTKGQGRKMEVNVNIGSIKLATLKRMVKGWSLFRNVLDPQTGELRPVALPYSIGNVEHLSKRMYTFLTEEIARLNPQDADEEVDENGDSPLPAPVPNSSEDTPAARRASRAK